MQVQEKGFSLNYVGQARPRFWSLFLCASVVGSGSLFTPDAKGYREFPIQVHPYYIPEQRGTYSPLEFILLLMSHF